MSHSSILRVKSPNLTPALSSEVRALSPGLGASQGKRTLGTVIPYWFSDRVKSLQGAPSARALRHRPGPLALGAGPSTLPLSLRFTWKSGCPMSSRHLASVPPSLERMMQPRTCLGSTARLNAEHSSQHQPFCQIIFIVTGTQVRVGTSFPVKASFLTQ